MSKARIVGQFDFVVANTSADLIAGFMSLKLARKFIRELGEDRMFVLLRLEPNGDYRSMDEREGFDDFR